MSKYEKWLSYKYEVVLPGSKKEVSFRPIKTKNMKRFLIVDDNIGSIDNAIDDVMNDCILSEDVKVEDMYLHDRFFLFVELRKKSKGSIFKFNHSCEKCNSQSLQVLDLNTLKVKEPDIYEEEIKLNENITIVLSLLTRNDQKQATNLAQGLNARNDSFSLTLLDSAMITHAMGIKKIITPEGIDEPTIQEKIEFINEIKPEEYEKIREWYDNRDFGIEMKHTIKCPHCLTEKEIEVPMDNFFF
jgi:Zn finger protein HypA/HybF involved in hydrogenase expression